MAAIYLTTFPEENNNMAMYPIQLQAPRKWGFDFNVIFQNIYQWLSIIC